MKERWIREGRCLSYDGKPALDIVRVLTEQYQTAKLAPVTCDAIADLFCRTLNTTDIDALTREWMNKP